MTDQELKDQAVAALKQTTISYPDWRRRVAAGRYTPKDGSETWWGKALAALDQIGAAPPPLPPPSAATRVLFAAVGDTSLDPVMNTNDPGWKKYVKDQYACLIGVWMDKWLEFGVPTFFYVDAQAVYAQPGADMSIVLKNSTGKPLYIDWGCSGGTCPQWAGDIGSAAYRAQYIARCQQHVAAGHKGIFMDDVNLGFNMTPGSGGGSSTPINPRTGAAYDSTTYKADWASLLEAVRATLPNTKIAHNSRWFDSANHDGKDPYVERQILACDYVNMERGVLDGGIHVGTDEWSIKRYFDFVDHVHSLGRSVVWMSYADNDKDAKATLAAYLVMREGSDMISTRTNAFPPAPYGPYQVDPGAAKGPRLEVSPYVWRRQFANATVTYDHNTRTGTVS